MKRETPASIQNSTNANRLAYGLYLVLVAYLLVKGDYEWAVTNLGIALVFDPFDAKVSWAHRPAYQKVWLIVHLTVTFAGLAYLIFR